MKITVVTVCYNCASEIEATIQSVINQTYKDIEYIVIDGASKDGTLDIINKYADRITKIVSEPDHGIYDAMNKGIDLATGDWVNFMNSGDLFYNNSVISEIFDQKLPFSDVIYGSTKVVDKEKEYIQEPYDLSFIKHGMPFCHQSVFVRTRVLKQYHFDLNFKVCADYNLFYKLIKQRYYFAKVQTIVAIYDMTGTCFSLTHIKDFKYETLKIKSSNKYMLWFKYLIINMLPKEIVSYLCKLYNKYLVGR